MRIILFNILLVLIIITDLHSEGVDSLDNNQKEQAQEIAKEVLEKQSTMEKKPWLAMTLSIVPGAGQIYNEDYWKAPILFGAAAGFTYGVSYWQSKFTEMEDLLASEDIVNYDAERVKLRRELYRDQRDQTAVYLAIIYVVTILDAYAGAHLASFDTGDDLSLSFSLSSQNIPQCGISLRLK